jgi:hypothetical protein
VEVYLHSFLTSAVDRGEWSPSLPGRLTPGERRSEPTEIVAGWALQVVWAFWRREKICFPYRKSKPGRRNSSSYKYNFRVWAGFVSVRALVIMVMNIQFPSRSWKFRSFTPEYGAVTNADHTVLLRSTVCMRILEQLACCCYGISVV